MLASTNLYLGPLVHKAHPLNKGLVAWYLVLPSHGATRWIDLVGTNHGTLTGAPVWAGSRGRPGGWGSLALNGTSQYVVVPDRDHFSSVTRGQLSVFAWVNPTLQASQYSVVTKGNVSNYEWSLFLDSGLPVTIWYDLAGNNYLQANAVVGQGMNVWQHIGFTGSAPTAVSLKVFCNGIPGTADTTASGTAPANGTSVVEIGRRADGSGPFPGSIDDVRIYNRQLSDAEVKALYLSSRQGYPGVLTQRRWTSGASAAAGTIIPILVDQRRRRLV